MELRRRNSELETRLQALRQVQEALKRSEQPLELALSGAELVPANQQLQREIDERRKTEEALRDSEQKFRSVVEASREGICVVQDGFLRFVNRSITAYLGYSQDELIGRHFTDFIFPEDRALATERYLAELGGHKQEPRFTFRVVDKSGLSNGWRGRRALSLGKANPVWSCSDMTFQSASARKRP